jgi:hypothetical protein
VEGERTNKNLPWIAALYAFIISAIFGLTNPPLQAPDEHAHLEYVNYLVTHKALPNQLDPEKKSYGEGHQHPLYYVPAAVVVAALNEGGPIRVTTASVSADGKARLSIDHGREESVFLLLRFLGAVLVGLLVLQVHRLAVLLESDPLWATMLAATLPQWLFIGSSVSNDGLVALLSSIAIASAVGASLENTPTNWVKAGAWAGAAFLAKKSAIILFPAGLLLFLLLKKKGAGSSKTLLGFSLAAFLLAAPIIVRNLVLYGEVLGNHMEIVSLPGLVTPRSIGDSFFVTDFPMMLASSFVGLFGWTAVQVPMRIVALYWLAVAPGLVVSLRSIRQPQVAYLWSVVVLNLVGLIHYNLTFTQAQGRLLFPSLAAFACIWGIGMTRLTSTLAELRYKMVARASVAGLVGLDLYSLILNYNFYRY